VRQILLLLKRILILLFIYMLNHIHNLFLFSLIMIACKISWNSSLMVSLRWCRFC